MKKIIAPRVHTNGDSKTELADNLYAAAKAIKEACKAFRETCPNARNYYVISPEAYGRARDEWCTRAAKLQSVIDELEALYGAVMDGEIEVEVRQ